VHHLREKIVCTIAVRFNRGDARDRRNKPNTYATLLDSALGCAVQSTLPAGYSYTTVELGMNIVRAART